LRDDRVQLAGKEGFAGSAKGLLEPGLIMLQGMHILYLFSFFNHYHYFSSNKFRAQKQVSGLKLKTQSSKLVVALEKSA